MHHQESQTFLLGSNNVLVVVAQWVADLDTEAQGMPTVRIISVRRADRREIRNMKMDEDVKPTQPPVPIDPDNPPLTGKENWGRWGDRVAAKIKAFDQRVAAREKAEQAQPPVADTGEAAE